MGRQVIDFKDRDGKWVKRFVFKRTNFFFTRMGQQYTSMYYRCHNNGSYKENFRTYLKCECAFIDFQDFAEWTSTQIGYEESDWVLDKDILLKGNKIYSKDTCVFIPTEINVMFTKADSIRGKYPIGVSFKKKTGKYVARVNMRSNVELGSYKTPEDAFYAYKQAKEAYIKDVANKWKAKIDPRVYEALMNYQVEITD